MAIKTRKPTGRVAFPMILLAGEAGAGKTWAALETSAMQEVDRCFVIEIGEGQADEYAAIPGADFEIVEHDGTLGQIRQAIADASAESPAEGTFNLLVIDSMTELWNLLKDEAQAAANQRRRGRKNQDGDYSISMDLWNRANDVWEGVIGQLKRFPGPVLLTARLTTAAVVDGDGRPTGAKDWKIDAQKNLPYRAQVVVQARVPRVWTMTKIATANPKLALKPGGETTFNDFNVAKLLTEMGVTPETENQNYVAGTVDGALADQQQRQKQPTQRNQSAQQYSDEDLLWRVKKFESKGDTENLVKMEAWAQAHGRAAVFKASGDALGRLKKVAEKAQETVQEQLGGEVVEGEIVA